MVRLVVRPVRGDLPAEEVMRHVEHKTEGEKAQTPVQEIDWRLEQTSSLLLQIMAFVVETLKKAGTVWPTFSLCRVTLKHGS